jgi:hypothetical protein
MHGVAVAGPSICSQDLEAGKPYSGAWDCSGKQFVQTLHRPVQCLCMLSAHKGGLIWALIGKDKSRTTNKLDRPLCQGSLKLTVNDFVGYVSCAAINAQWDDGSSLSQFPCDALRLVGGTPRQTHLHYSLNSMGKECIMDENTHFLRSSTNTLQ